MKKIVKSLFVLSISIFIILLYGLFFCECKDSYANIINIYENIDKINISSDMLKLQFLNPNCISNFTHENIHNLSITNNASHNKQFIPNRRIVNNTNINNILKYPYKTNLSLSKSILLNNINNIRNTIKYYNNIAIVKINPTIMNYSSINIEISINMLKYPIYNIIYGLYFNCFTTMIC